MNAVSWKRSDLCFTQLCDEIDYLKEELDQARAEAAEYRQKYGELVQQSIQHSQKVAMGMVGMAIALKTPDDPAAVKFGKSLCEQAAL